MTTYTEVLPAQAASPHNALAWTPSGHGCGVLAIDRKKCRCRYLVEELPVPDGSGRGFRFTKLDPGTDAETPVGDTYTPFVAMNPQDCSCECKGFVYGGGRPCVHVLACRALIENGWV